MIIGRGLIASLFRDIDRPDAIFFASGVSNSLETKKEEFLREEQLIRKTIDENPTKTFIYFSTCSIYDSSKTGSPYVLHKLKMEQLIVGLCPKYLILRVSNAVGKGGNPNLLMNYLVRAVRNRDTINVHTKATRNLIDTEDVKNMTLWLLEHKITNKIMNLAYPENYSIIEILQTLETVFRVPLNLNLIKTGSGYHISIGDMENYFEHHQVPDKDAYLLRMLSRYYS